MLFAAHGAKDGGEEDQTGVAVGAELVKLPAATGDESTSQSCDSNFCPHTRRTSIQ